MNIKKYLSHHLTKQMIKFGVGGVLTFATDYGTFSLLFALSIPLFIASTTSFLAGFAVSFTVNKLWVFGATKEMQHHRTHLQIVLYIALLVFNVLFTYYFIFFTGKLGLSAYVAKLMTIGMIMAWNFVLYKKVIFRVKS